MKKLFLSLLTIVVLLAVPATALADSELKARAALTGLQEVSRVQTLMRGAAEIQIGNGELHMLLRVKNNTNDIFAAHIHCAPPNVNGPIGLTLFMGSFTAGTGVLVDQTFTSPDPGNQCGWATIDDVAAAIQSANAYVNVHTTAASGGVPSGEIRGNLGTPSK
jgi:hypothetical protein